MITLTQFQNKAARESYDKYTGTHKISFQEMKNLFVAEFSKIPYWDFKPAHRVANDFYDFVEDYYFELRKQEAKPAIKYELKSLLELKKLDFDPNNEQLNELNNELICATCKRKFAGIKALHGHKNKCKPN